MIQKASHDHQSKGNPGDSKPEVEGVSRRALLAAGGAAAVGITGLSLARQAWLPTAPVFIASGQRYDGSLTDVIRNGLVACEIRPEWFRGKRVLLKPNMVEPTKLIPHMTTHPAVILAAAEVFRVWGATVLVGEAPGHVRDTEIALFESGVGEALIDAELPFSDLNYEEVKPVENRGRYSNLQEIYFPRSVLDADWVVSLPKMKTHHWVGITCSMKNFYGVLPGIKYGWPKNSLHQHGIPQTVLDINASMPNTLAIVDAIDCMEGDGPIMGDLKRMGLILVGRNLPAVDATAARIMGLEPSEVSYLSLASNRLGPIQESRIDQRGDLWSQVASPFKVLEEPHLQRLRMDRLKG